MPGRLSISKTIWDISWFYSKHKVKEIVKQIGFKSILTCWLENESKLFSNWFWFLQTVDDLIYVYCSCQRFLTYTILIKGSSPIWWFPFPEIFALVLNLLLNHTRGLLNFIFIIEISDWIELITVSFIVYHIDSNFPFVIPCSGKFLRTINFAIIEEFTATSKTCSQNLIIV